MNPDERETLPSVVPIVEAILFASDRPVTFEELRGVLPEADEESVLDALEELEREYLGSSTRGVLLQEVAGGYQLTTRPEVGLHVERFLVGKRRARLSRAALETLATIAYRQPITRGEIEALRGVDSGHVVSRLLERDLIAVRGRSEALGRPLLYGTTTEFLRYFGVTALSDLPALEEFAGLSSADPLDDPEIREALESEGLWSRDEDGPGSPQSDAVPIPIVVLSTERRRAEGGRDTAGGNGDHADNGYAPTNGNGDHADNGQSPTNGNGDHADNGHAPTNGNGDHAGNGHAPTAGNGAPGTELGQDARDEGEGADERSEVDRSAGGAFVAGTAVSGEFEPPSFGDEEDEFEEGTEGPRGPDEADRQEVPGKRGGEAGRGESAARRGDEAGRGESAARRGVDDGRDEAPEEGDLRRAGTAAQGDGEALR